MMEMPDRAKTADALQLLFSIMSDPKLMTIEAEEVAEKVGVGEEGDPIRPKNGPCLCKGNRMVRVSELEEISHSKC